MTDRAVEAPPAEQCEVYKIYRAACFEDGCGFEARGDTANDEANQHSIATGHPFIRVHFAGDTWFSRPRPTQRLLADRTLAAKTVEAVRALWTEAAQAAVLDEMVHGLFGTMPLRGLLDLRAEQLQPAT